MVSQTYFDRCELVIVDGASPDNERSTIEEYMEKHNNISYHRLDVDPGIYGCWNKAIEHSSGEYITNANLDDRRSNIQIEEFVKEMDESPDIDLIYSYCFVTNKPHEDFNNNSSGNKVYPTYSFTRENMLKCLPGCMPLWRRSMHNGIGFFNENYISAGDWEMWLRAVRNGSSFKMKKEALGLYYMNPTGVSTNFENEAERFKEEKEVFWEYTDIFGLDVTNRYREYFSK
jgi:glycosyltransferase involved in cell wall biosynthesis